MPPRTEYQTAATVKRGKFRLENPQRWIEAMREFRDGAVIAGVKTVWAHRSADHNRAYWAGYIRPLSDATGYEPLALHAYFKSRYLPSERIVLADANGEIRDDCQIARPTTTTLSTAEFADFLIHVSTFASELGIRVGGRDE